MTGFIQIIIGISYLFLRAIMSFKRSCSNKKAIIYFDGLVVFPILVYWGFSIIRVEQNLTLPLIVILAIIPLSLFLSWVILYVSALAGEKKALDKAAVKE